MTTTPGAHAGPVTIPAGDPAATRRPLHRLIGAGVVLLGFALVAAGSPGPRAPATTLVAAQTTASPDAGGQRVRPGAGVDLTAQRALRELAEQRTSQLTAQARAIRAEVRRLATTFNWPVRGPVAVPFGVREHPVSGKRLLHNGIDIDAACGQAVTAPMAGRVLHAGYADDAGYFLRIDHGVVNGVSVYTTYLHLNGFLVRGGTLSRGQPVARVGATGDATDCHLHFSMVRDGRPVDPLRYLGSDQRRA